MNDDGKFYKIIMYPFTKSDAVMIKNYLAAFDKNRTVVIEGID